MRVRWPIDELLFILLPTYFLQIPGQGFLITQPTKVYYSILAFSSLLGVAITALGPGMLPT